VGRISSFVRGGRTEQYSSDHAYEENGIFHSDSRYKEYSHHFATSGETQRFEIEKFYFDVKYFTAIYFHDQFPVLEKTVVVEVPKWLNLELKEMNFEGYNIEKNVVEKPGKATIYTYKASALKGTHNERNMPGRSHVLPHLLVLAKSYQMNKETGTLLASTENLYQWYRELLAQVKNDPKPLESMVSKLTAGKTTDEEKIKSIYYWVQDNMRYIAFENGIAGFKPEAAQKVFSDKYGDCKGMANLLKSMLIIAGFDARLTWIGTRHIAYDYSIPSLCVDNHAICTVILKDKRIFLDGTEKYMPLGKYAHRIQGRPVMIENGESYILDKVPEAGCEANRSSEKVMMELKGLDLVGTGEYSCAGDAQVSFLHSYHSTRTEDRSKQLLKWLGNNDKDMEVVSMKTSDLDDREAPLHFTYDFVARNQVIESDGDYFVTMDNGKNFRKFDFDSTRQFDYEFSYKIDRSDEMAMKVPAGFRVKHLPAPVSRRHPEFSFDLSYSESNGVVTYTRKIRVTEGIVHRKDFDKWNECIADLRRFYDDQVILKKN
jgi:transglutaminase-like putative cysteine protease